MLESFLKEVEECLNPFGYKNLEPKSFGRNLSLIFKIMLLGYLIAALVSIPLLANLPSEINEKLSSIETFALEGNLTMNSPVYLPTEKPFLVVDTTGENQNLTGTAKILVTNKYIKYKLFDKTKKIKLSKFEDITESKEFFSNLLGALAWLIFPAILFYSVLIFLVKYLLTILLVALFTFVILDLTMFKLEFRRVMHAAFNSSLFMVLTEIISQPVNTEWLWPGFKVLGINFYFVPLIIFLTFFFPGIIFNCIAHGKRHW